MAPRRIPRQALRGDRPRRKRALGQHHLRDGALCRSLLDFLRLAPGDRVLEIGSGGGVLTRELLGSGAGVVAVELDLPWAAALRSSAAHGRQAGLSLVVADALELDWTRLPVGWRVAGNLPYNVGTAIVERMLRAAAPGTRAGFLLQREVVDRMVARPGSAAYGALSLLVEARARAERLAVVKPGSFIPPPRVDSAFVGLEVVAPPLPDAQMAGFERLVQVAFGQRRKNLRNALGAGYGRTAADAALARSGIASDRRAEQLGLSEFLALWGSLHHR